MLLFAHVENLTLGSDKLYRVEIVERQSVLAHQPAYTAAERQTADSRRRHDASSSGETVDLCFAVELVPDDAALRACRARLRIDVYSLHEGHIDHQAIIDGRPARDAVTTTANRDLER